MSEREEKFKNMVKFKKLVASGCMIYEHDNLDYAIAETYSYSEDDPDYGSLFAAAPEMYEELYYAWLTLSVAIDLMDGPARGKNMML